MTLYTHQSSNKTKTWLLMFSFLGLVSVFGYALSLYMGNSIILYIAVGFSIVSSFVSYWWSDKIVLKMSNAKEIKFNDNKELYRLVENLCITAGLPLPKIYIINDTAPNAFATGRDAEHAVVAVTKGLLQKLDRAELEGVIAHELSHIGNRDILLMTVVTVLVGVVVLLADWARHFSMFGGRRDSKNTHPVIIVVAIVLSLLAPLFASLMQLAVSRKREFLADASAALLTRHPEGLARALEKIAMDREPLEVANRATAHLYISTPFKKKTNKKPSFFAKAFMTHPPTEERIAALRNLNV